MRTQLLMLKAQRTRLALGLFNSSGRLMDSKGSTLITDVPENDLLSATGTARRAPASDAGHADAAPTEAKSVSLSPVCQLPPRISGRRSDDSMHRSGLLARPSLLSTAPPGWEVPPKVCLAADAFDRRHNSLVRSAEVLMRSLITDSTSLSKATNFNKALREVRWNRYQLDAFVDGADVKADAAAAHSAAQTAAASRRAEGAAGTNGGSTADGAKEAAWSLESSIWGPRRHWCDARDYFDTGSVRRRMFECDWARALSQSGLAAFILRNDDDGAADADGDGRPDEIDEVRDVLWEHHQLLTMVFDFYASRGSSRDPFSISQNGFNLFVSQCGLAVAGSAACQVAHLDQLFLEANAGGARGQADKYNAARALNRHEFLQCIVRIAVARYVMTERCVDVPCSLPHPSGREQSAVSFSNQTKYLSSVGTSPTLWPNSAHAAICGSKRTGLCTRSVRPSVYDPLAHLYMATYSSIIHAIPPNPHFASSHARFHFSAPCLLSLPSRWSSPFFKPRPELP
jgi:hypothetical protein